MVDAVENEYVNSEIVCTLAALGYLEDDSYYKGDDCIGEYFTTNCNDISNNFDLPLENSSFFR